MSTRDQPIVVTRERSEISRFSSVSWRAAIIAVLCGVVSVALIERTQPAPEHDRKTVAPIVVTPAHQVSAPRVHAKVETPYNAEATPAVEYKYRYLLSDIRMQGVDVTEVAALLARREQLAVTNDSHAARAQIDDQLRAHLHPADYSSYELLRDSDEEQHHLNEYLGGLTHLAPLDEQQERAVLERKLLYKARSQRLLESFGSGAMSAAERTYAFEAASEALVEHYQAFLDDVRLLLSDEQFAALSAYESTELERGLARRQRTLNEQLTQP